MFSLTVDYYFFFFLKREKHGEENLNTGNWEKNGAQDLFVMFLQLHVKSTIISK